MVEMEENLITPMVCDSSGQFDGHEESVAISCTAAQPSMALNCAPRADIQNIVCGTHLGFHFNLHEVHARLRYSEYNPQTFAAAVLRIHNPKMTALLFSNGKMVIAGGRDEASSKLGARKFVRILQKLGAPVRLKNFKIHNMVGMCDIKFPVKLEAFAKDHQQFCRFEPEIFPALIYRLLKPRLVALVFVNGKVVITGGKSCEEINKGIELIYPILCCYKKSKE